MPMDQDALAFAERMGRPTNKPVPIMGEGAYAIPNDPSAPLGWDYDTLVSALTSMGYPNLDREMSDGMMVQTLDSLERGRATNNQQAEAIIRQILESADPYNEFAGHLPSSIEDSPGYWDAENNGDGYGNSFVHTPGPAVGYPGWDTPEGDGTYYPADPVRNGPDARLMQTFINQLTRGR